jgi:hypothetical protein
VDVNVKDRWVTALRSGNYIQGMGFLNANGQLCALGVLCDLAEQAGIAEGVPDEVSGVVYYDDSTSVLPDSVRVWAGLDENDPIVEVEAGDTDGFEKHPISDLNDGWNKYNDPWSFSEIADVIEALL